SCTASLSRDTQCPPLNTLSLHDALPISTFAYKAGGGISLRPSLLQRAYRDLHAGTQHVFLSDQIYQECARVLLGMTGKNPRWGRSEEHTSELQSLTNPPSRPPLHKNQSP